MPLQPGNQKLGLLVWTWSLPAGDTCPGKTQLCHRVCYALKGHFTTPAAQRAHQENRKLADSATFAAWMITEVQRCYAQVVRIHTAGDFFSAAYVRKWLQVVRGCPRTTFYCYTRSWGSPRILPALLELAGEPNLHLWFSCDNQSPEPPVVPRVRRAWMAENDQDLAPFPVDLVFRVKRRTVMLKDPHGQRVCPYDNGRAARPTCSQCQLCFQLAKVPHA